MKRILFSIVFTAAILLLQGSAPIDPSVFSSSCTPNTSDPAVDNFDFSILAKKPHPRMYMSDEELKEIKAEVNAGANPYVLGIHNQIMKMADDAALNIKPIERVPKENNARLDVKGFPANIICCAYAYRFTGKAKYLNYVKYGILDICNFEDWLQTNALSTAALCLCVGIGYDWIYDKLDAKTKKFIEETIYEKGFSERKLGHNGWWYSSKINWNQVCNGGFVCAALAAYTGTDSIKDRECVSVIKDAVYSNKPAVEGLYAPSGIYAEGPNYWRYGTGYQTFLNAALETALGTDFGLSDNEYFKKTGWYKLFSTGCTGLGFNYADCKEPVGASPALWYFAARFNQPELLFKELEYSQGDDEYKKDKLPILLLTSAHKVGMVTAEPPEQRVFSGGGAAPLVIARTGWDKEDIYVGLKGGSGKSSHGHMDVGEFIYESQGVRWGIDLEHTDYSILKRHLAKLPKDGRDINLHSKNQNAYRWEMIEYNNRFHNTLTINDRDHQLAGYASLGQTIDEADRIGGSMDFNDTFYDDIQSGSRTVLIRDDSYLEVTDSLLARADSSIHVRWTMLTRANVEVREDCLVLTQDGKTLTIRVEGCKPEFKTWSTNPKDYEGLTRSFERWHKDAYACGYEYDIPANTQSVVVTTMKN